MKYKYLSGNAFKSVCKYSSGHYSSAREPHFDFKVRKDLDNNYVFVKTEYIATFFEYIHLDFPFKIITHNSDEAIDHRFLKYLDNPLIEEWYGQNINVDHPKLRSIPIGLANPKWAHGNQRTMDLAIDAEYWKDKKRFVYVNFDIGTNPPERQKCLQETGLQMAGRESFPNYLRDMGESFFALSPNGNGIDCHKHWECFYMRTIPIVTRSLNLKYYRDYPFLIIDDWKDFKDLELTPELYKKIWNNFNVDHILLDNYLLKIGLQNEQATFAGLFR